MNKLFDYLLIIFLIIIVMLASSCVVEEELVLPELLELEIDGRLEIDSNGFYHLELQQDTNQTLHTISGTVGNTLEPIKVDWTSNLTWVYQDNLVSTINCCSYPNENGEIHTVIAPIRSMVGDTMRISASVHQYNVSKQINIVLE